MVKKETNNFNFRFFIVLLEKYAIITLRRKCTRMRRYYNYKIKKTVRISNLLTIETLNLSSTFNYPVEKHEFYEFAYIDSGILYCKTENTTEELKQGDFYFIKPNTTHSYYCNHEKSASIFIVCFNSQAKILDVLDGKSVLDKHLRYLLQTIIEEAESAFQLPFYNKIKLLEKPKFGAQQMFLNYTENFLISLLRVFLSNNSDVIISTDNAEFEDNVSSDIVRILNDNLYSKISLDEISRELHFSKAYLNKLFKKNKGAPIMQYYMHIKIKEAKKLLRDNLSVAEVSEKMSFDEPTYFTKVFKKITGITPSEYKNTILK